ncbi:tyrosine-type recombinase/integrase [Candidatus Sororendozoicomonas aggregata]|uniref:tyrosine-type recombinase/integrase n=1 Tax=Candidatus Sororendozoicomonas aggregata TaxID=3073239 RepID=UPI002ED3BF50
MPVKNLILSDGERYPILLDEDGVPDYWATLYVTEHLRQKSNQTSIENALGHLVHLRLWEKINNRSLEDELSQSVFPSDDDIYSLRDHCRLESQSLKKWHTRKPNNSVVKFAHVAAATVPSFSTVSTRHTYNRLTQVAYYLEFIAKVVLRDKLRWDEELTKSIESMRKQMLANRPKGTSRGGLVSDPDTKAPPSDNFEHFMGIVKEDSPDNPFKSETVRFRNSLMFEVMYETGMRSGELLGLQTVDVDFHGASSLFIKRRHDSLEDPRRRQPVAKTRERKLPLKKRTADRLKHYVMEIRAEIEPARKHPYLFVTHKKGKDWGRPISASTFVLILNSVKNVSPDLLKEIKKHGFQHDSNYRLSNQIDEINKAAKDNPDIKPINEKMEIQIRKDIYGWDSDQSAEVYNQRHVRNEANRLMREDMDHWTEFTKKGK